MKLFVVVLIIAIVAVFGLSACGLWQGKPPRQSLVDGKLRRCPDSPNCVCSEYPQREAFIEPFRFTGSIDAAVEALRQSVAAAGGTVQDARPEYLRATFTTRFLRFVDDVEFRPAPEEGVIHVRSASRVGYSDFGVNRRRVERLRELFLSRLE